MKFATSYPFVELRSIVAETQYGTSDLASENGGMLPILRMNNITHTGNFDLTNLKRIDIADRDIEKYTVRRGDLLFNRTNSRELVGKTAVWESDDCFAFAGYLIRVRFDETKASARYVSAFLNSSYGKSILFARAKPSVNMSNISATDLLRLEIPLPPLADQRRITDILDKAGALRRKCQDVAGEIAHLRVAVLYEMFGDRRLNSMNWPTKRLDELVERNDKINYGVVQPGNDVSDGIPIVRVGDLADLRINKTELKRIAPEIESSYSRSRLKGDEILIACVGSIGLIALADESTKGFNIARAVARIRCGSEVNRLYLAAFLSTPFVQSYFTQETRTVSQPTLNIKQIEETQVLVPPRTLQDKYAGVVSQAMKTLVRLEAAQSDSQTLFDSLVQRAFRGDL